VTGYRFGFSEDTVRLAAALRPALASRGVPDSIYVDNGSSFVDSWLLRACASLGIKLVHSTPGRPQGRGKIERFFRTVREQFLVEITEQIAAGISGLPELNRLLAAWVETVYHTAIHSETGMAPLARWRAGIPDPLPLPSPTQLREAFLWSEFRIVTTNATVSLHNNRYQVDELLIGRKVELVFDPFDLTDIDIRYFGKAVAFTIGRHTHPKARPEHPIPPPSPAGSTTCSCWIPPTPSSWKHGSTTPPCSATSPPATTPATPIVSTPAAVVHDAATTPRPLGLHPPTLRPRPRPEHAAPPQRPR
jgi:putative transposase